jgi:hypothetical protein
MTAKVPWAWRMVDHYVSGITPAVEPEEEALRDRIGRIFLLHCEGLDPKRVGRAAAEVFDVCRRLRSDAASAITRELPVVAVNPSDRDDLVQ